MAVLDILKLDFAFGLVVLAVLLQVRIDLIDERVLHGLVRRAAVLEPARVVVVLRQVQAIGKGERHVDLHVVKGKVFTVSHPLFGLPELNGGHRVVAAELAHVVLDAVFVAENRRFKFFRRDLVFENKLHARIDDRLPAERVRIVLDRHRDVGKDLEIRLPANDRAGVLLFRIWLLFQAADVLAALKMQRVAEAVVADVRIHILRGVLRRAEAEAVEAERKIVVAAVVVVVFAARVHLAENQLPVVAVFALVEIDRDAAAVVLHLDGLVEKACNGDLLAIALPRLVDGVGEDFKYRVLAAVDAVGAENHRRAQAHPVRAL